MGTALAGFGVVRHLIAELVGEWNSARRRSPLTTYGVTVAFTIVASFGVLTSAVFLSNLPKGLPDDAALSRIGEMAQATTVYDGSDRLVFTIYKEQLLQLPMQRLVRSQEALAGKLLRDG